MLLIAAITLKNFEVLRGNCSIYAALRYVYDKGVYFFKVDKYGPWDINTTN